MTKAGDKSSLILASDESGRPSSFVNSMSPVDEHGEASCADDLLFTFMITGEVHSGLIVGPTDETFELFACHVIPLGPH